MKIAVMGSGGWGTALALVLLENGHEVTLWSYREEESTILREKRENPMLKGVPLPDGLALTSDRECVKNCKVVVLATPSFAVRTTARAVASLLEPSAVLVSVSKGIEKDTSLTLTDAIAQEVGEGHPIVALSGPSHAEEVGRGVPTVVVSASRDKAAAELVQDLFMNERFRVYASDDVVGVELGAALKNVIALCAGIGIRPDPAQAVYWFRKAAEGGSGRAMCLLGDCYREGQGVEADAAQARTCYQKAIDLGFDAKEELEELDKAAPAGAGEQPKKKKPVLGRLFGK